MRARAVPDRSGLSESTTQHIRDDSCQRASASTASSPADATATSSRRLEPAHAASHIEFRLSRDAVLLSRRRCSTSLVDAARDARRAAARQPGVPSRPPTTIVPPRVPRGARAKRGRRSCRLISAWCTTDDGLEGRLVELQAFPSLYGFQLALGRGLRARRTSCDELDAVISAASTRRATSRAGRPRDRRRPRSRRGRADGDRSAQPEDAARLRGDRAALGRARRRRPQRRSRTGRSCSTGATASRRRSRASTTASSPTSSSGSGVDARRSTTATTSTSSGPAARTGSSGSASSRFRGCGIRGCRRRTSSSDIDEPAAPIASEWLLKPLFSFAGGGIIFAPTDARLAAIPPDERAHYILQERVAFTPVIDTPHGPTQAEIRIMFVRDGDALPRRCCRSSAWAAAR